jgi:hypothetical protein
MCFFSENVFFDTLLPLVWFSNEQGGTWHIDLAHLKILLFRWCGSGLYAYQPLTTLVGTKCKQCGLYEKDTFKSDDIFDEWELCPFNFTLDPEGHYVHLKDKEFNMTLSCPQCCKFQFSVDSQLQNIFSSLIVLSSNILKGLSMWSFGFWIICDDLLI